MNGVKRGNKSIYVAHFPERKKPCLVVEENNRGTIVATFRSEDDVKLFWEYVDSIIFCGDCKKEEQE